MLLIYTLLLLTATTALIFAVPLRAKAWTALALVAAAALTTSVTALRQLSDDHLRLVLWQTQSPLFGSDTGSIDSLSALFILLIGIGSISAVLYSRGYLAHALHEHTPAHISLHYTALVTLYLSMLGVVTSEGGYSFLLFWELMTLSSFLLILFDAKRREVRRAAIAYLIMMHIGFVLLVAGFVRLDAVCGAADFTALSGYFRTQNPLPLFLIFLAGFGMKAGIFPLHVWLPEAHPAAPSHVSALMSGVMIKTGVYGILRITLAMTGLPALSTAGTILLTVGIVTALWGVMLAAAQNDVKRLLAYSSIENIGIILIGIGIAALGKSAGNQTVAVCGICGALLHTLNHSFFKSLLFFGAGNLLSQIHTTSLDKLGGVAKHMPITAILFLGGTAALCALPPLGGFVSELLIFLGLFDGIASESNVLAAGAGLAALALTGGIALLAFTKLYGTVFLGNPRSHEVAEASETDNYRIAAMAIPLAGLLFTGLFPQTAVSLVVRAAGELLPGGNTKIGELLLNPTLVAVGRTAWLLIIVVGVVAWLRHRTLQARTIRTASTWGCGFTSPNIRMQYTGESFSEGLQTLTGGLTKTGGEHLPVDKSELFPAAHHFEIRRKDRIDRLFTAWWVELLGQINRRVMHLRTGKINHYILFALAFLVLVLLLSLLNVIR